MTPTYAAAHRVRSLVVTLSANSARRSRSAVFGMNGKRRAALLGRGVLGLLLGLAVAVTVRAVLLLSLRRGRDIARR